VDEDVENFGLGVKSGFVEAVCHDVEDISANSHVVLAIKDVGDGCIFIDVSQNLLEQVQAQIGVGAELVPQGPNHAIQYGVKVALLERKQRCEVELHQRLEEAEEVGSDFGEGVEVAGDERQT
jgi:hypothetical protein